MTREELSPKASEMIKAHGLDEVYLTSKGEGFTELHRAENAANYLKDKKIFHFVKSKEAVAKIEIEDIDEDNHEGKEVLNVSTEATTNIETEETEEDNQEDERTALVAKYELLFNKKPAHNIGVEKLKTQIAEKEAELENVPVVVEDTITTTAPVENPTEENKDLK